MPGAPPGTLFDAVHQPQLGGAGDLVVFYGWTLDLLPEVTMEGVYVSREGGEISRVIDPFSLGSLPGATSGLTLGELSDYDIDETGLVVMSVEGVPPDNSEDPVYNSVIGWRDGEVFPIAWPGQSVPGGPEGAIFTAAGGARAGDGAAYFFVNRQGMSPESAVYRWADGDLAEVDRGDLMPFRVLSRSW